MFVADDLGAWLVALLADAGRKRLVAAVLGSDQERALCRAAAAAITATAQELSPAEGDRAAQEISSVSRKRTTGGDVPDLINPVSLSGSATTSGGRFPLPFAQPQARPKGRRPSGRWSLTHTQECRCRNWSARCTSSFQWPDPVGG